MSEGVRVTFGGKNRKSRQAENGHSEPVYSREIITIDWNKIREDRLARIKQEIDAGLNPPEAWEVDAAKPKPEKKKRTRSTNPGNPTRKYDHADIIKRYRDGESGLSIARSIGANPATVYGIISRAGETREYNGGRNQYTVREDVPSNELL